MAGAGDGADGMAGGGAAEFTGDSGFRGGVGRVWIAATAAQGREMDVMLGQFVGLMVGRSPFEISFYRKVGAPLARSGGLVAATAYSAGEQALWNLAGQALGVPTSTLFGGH